VTFGLSAIRYATGRVVIFKFEGIPQELCERFFKRREQIDAALAKLLAEKPELKAGNMPEIEVTACGVGAQPKAKDLKS